MTTVSAQSMSDTASIDRALKSLSSGEIVVLVDDLAAHECATLVAPANTVTTAQMATLVLMGSGFVEIAIDYRTARRLHIPPMPGVDISDAPIRDGVLSGVGVDAATGVTTGISAADRAYTARLIASPSSVSSDLSRPGHLLPVIIGAHALHQPMSLLAGALAMTRLATGTPAAVHCELVSAAHRTEMANGEEAAEIAEASGFPVITLSEFTFAHRRRV